MPNPDQKVGRPLKFKTPEELQSKIDLYFAECDPHIAERDVIRDHDVLEAPAEKDDDGRVIKKAVWKREQIVAKEQYITVQIPYTITGMAVFLDTNRQTLLNYAEKDDKDREDGLSFFDTVKRAKDKIQAYAEKELFRPSQAAGVIFNLKNNWGWKDQKELEVNPGGNPIGVVYLPHRDDVPDNPNG